MKSTLRLLLMTLFVLATFQATAQERYNILFIAVDDLKPLIGSYGDEMVHSPNLDRLSSMGMIFTNSHCQQAVCGPSRASLMTGMRPDYTRVWDLQTKMRDMVPDILTMPQYFKENGYSTVAIGKIYDPRCVDDDYDGVSWSIPYDESSKYSYPEEYGEPLLSYYASPEAKKAVEELREKARSEGVKNVQAYIREKYKPSTESADVPDEAYMDGQIAANGIKYMQSLAGDDNPFFLAVGFKRPHLPFVAPTKFWDLYDREDIKLAEYQEPVKDGVEMAYHNYGELRSYTDIPAPESFTDIFTNRVPEEKQKELIHGYYASVSFIDAQVGKLLDELENLGIADKTIVVLWGDHGWHLGDHSLWCKHSNFEQATRSPLIITYPGSKKGSYAKPVEFIDIFPTLCELTGIQIPSNLQGKSLKPAFDDPEIRIKPYAVSQFGRGTNNGYSIRTERHRLTLWIRDSYRTGMPFNESMIVDGELYDYQKDPNETVNLYRSPDHKNVRDRMMGHFVKFLETQNRELSSTSGMQTKKDQKGKKENKTSSQSLPSLETYEKDWRSYVRNGGVCDFTFTNGILIIELDKSGNSVSDIGFQTRNPIALKAGQVLEADITALGGEFRLVLGPVGDSRVIKSFKPGDTFTSKTIKFEIPVDGDWILKLQFADRGHYEINNLTLRVE